MRKIKKVGIFVFMAVLGAWGMNYALREKDSQHEIYPDPVTQAPSLTTSSTVLAQVTVANSMTKKEAASAAEEIQKEYQQVAYFLAQKITENQLDVIVLNEWAAKLEHDDFMRKLPNDVREGYENLDKVILKIRNHHLKEDGMTESFFTKYQVEMPRWLQKRRQEVNSYLLPQEISAIVQQKISESEVTNNDVGNILRGCGKNNSNCIDKAFALLIDANHALNDDQLKMIQEYL